MIIHCVHFSLLIYDYSSQVVYSLMNCPQINFQCDLKMKAFFPKLQQLPILLVSQLLALFPKLLSLFKICLWHIQIMHLIKLNYFILF